MYFKATRDIPLGLIKQEDTFFKFSSSKSYKSHTSRSIKRLKLSIEKLGITNPIITQSIEKEGCYRIINGFKRFQVAKELNFSFIPVHILRDDLSPSEILTVMLLSSFPPFSVVEKAKIVRIMSKLGLSASQICQEFAPFLGVGSAQLVKDYRHLSSFPTPVLSYIEKYGLSVKQALAFADLPPGQQRMISSMADSLSLKGYDTYNILTDLKEIAIREKKSVHTVLDELKVADVVRDETLPRSEKIGTIKSLLRMRRYPKLTTVNKKLRQIKSKMHLSCPVNISWDKDLEKRAKLYFKVKDTEDIRRAVEQLLSPENRRWLDKFFKVYYEGLSDRENMGGQKSKG